MNPVSNETLLLADFCQNDIFFGYQRHLTFDTFFGSAICDSYCWVGCLCVCGGCVFGVSCFTGFAGPKGRIRVLLQFKLLELKS